MSVLLRPPQRPIKRLLIANRGEIATRVISTARELQITTYAIFTPGDDSHALNADHAIELPSASTFLDVDALINLTKSHDLDAVHPGYGFLSESDVFARRMWQEAGVVVVGPGWDILENTGDKLKARELAERCNVPVSPALRNPTADPEVIRAFAAEVGYPIMVKAVDGGGGRGIRLINNAESLHAAVTRAVEESPSKQLFAEKAAVDGFRHIEVQIIGDGTGTVTHLWERECSIQRRYQKVVEIAPSMVSDRELIAKIIEDALRMAASIGYVSLGTFEFLVNPTTQTYFFLEINPRLQVEHTVTETVTSTDIVRAQLLIGQGHSLATCGLPDTPCTPRTPPPLHSLELRITAENVAANWSLSIGKITSFQFPSGNGVRVDSHLVNGHAAIVSYDFDSLIAKIIVTASSWPAVAQKAQRALADTRISGVKTNIDILRGIIAHEDFLNGECDTQWLEAKQSNLLALGERISSSTTTSALARQIAESSSLSPSVTSALAPSTTLFRKGDAWSITLSPPAPATSPTSATTTTDPSRAHHLELTRIHRNDFPTSLTASILYTPPSSSSSSSSRSTPYTLDLSSTSASAHTTTSSSHRRANPTDPSHIRIPFSGKLIEVLVDEGDAVREGDVVCVVQQMKMELEVRSPRSGCVSWIMEVEDGEDVAEGMLAAVVEREGEARL